MNNKYIKMLSGEVVAISSCDFENVSKHSWSIGRNWSPRRQFRLKGKNKTEYLHRFILSPKNGEHVDHRDGNKLNATRSNLRLCSRHQNIQNQKISTKNSSGYKGACLDKRNYLSNRWCAEITAFGKKRFIGRFFTKEEAAKAYDSAAKELHGQFAKTNFV